MELSNDQAVALDAILSELNNGGREAVLAGAAGTGKTTVMSVVIERWNGDVMFLAPTGKAAVRITEQTKRPARTIHSAIYGAAEEAERVKGTRKENLRFGEPRPPDECGPRTLVVVDEASMVNTALARDVRDQVLSTGAALLWVGDHEQLPPVEGGWGVALQNPTARLTTVHRQALESPVLELATLIRMGRGSDFTRWGDDCRRTTITAVQEAVDWAEASSERVLLTWTNKVRVQANRLTRASRNLPKKALVTGERVICTYNQHTYGVMNGETFTVEGVQECDELTRACGQPVVWVKLAGREKRVLMAPHTFDAYHPYRSDRQLFKDVWARVFSAKDAPALMQEMGWGVNELRHWRNAVDAHAIQGTYAYCITVHKAQGSQFPEVGFVSCPQFRGYADADFKKRLSYTAVTRAQTGFNAFVLTV